MIKLQLLLFSITCLLGHVKQTEAQNKRCTWLGEKIFGACKVSCKVLGRDTGVCDDDGRCICSESEYDFFADVREWFEENLDPSRLTEKLDAAFPEYENLTIETERGSRVKVLENENAHHKTPIKERTFNCTMCTTVTNNNGSTTSSNHPITATGLNPDVILVIGIALFALGIVFIIITAGYICCKRCRYPVRIKHKLESLKIEPMNRASNACLISTEELSFVINFEDNTVNNNPGFILENEKPEIQQISIQKSDGISPEMQSYENTGMSES